MSTLEILLYGQIGASIMMFFAWMHAIGLRIPPMLMSCGHMGLAY